jgi:O-methyltransferase involved in polyketide biosynthesis
MLGPLWARAKYSQLYPKILSDTEAERLIQKVMANHTEAESEFKAMDKFIDEFYGLIFLIRARTFDDAIKNFITKYPTASIVNIGCGLDTTFFRVDNHQIMWYNLDLPEAIAYRQKWLPESDRNCYIAKSVFDYSWFEKANFNPEHGLFCIAGGLFHYFPENQVADLLSAMAEKFPGGELFFDMPSKLGIWIIKQRLRSYGIQGITMHFGLGNPVRKIHEWSNCLQVLEWFPFFARISRKKKWKWRTRLMMWLNDWLGVSKFVHVQFRPISEEQ